MSFNHLTIIKNKKQYIWEIHNVGLWNTKNQSCFNWINLRQIDQVTWHIPSNLFFSYFLVGYRWLKRAFHLDHDKWISKSIKCHKNIVKVIVSNAYYSLLEYKHSLETRYSHILWISQKLIVHVCMILWFT